MRAVNLIPADSRGRSSSRGPSTGMQIPVYVLLGVLAAAVALVTMYVLTNNSITSRKAEVASLKTQVAQEQAAANRLGEFSKFSSLAQTRIGTVNSIASARFDWHTALVNLSKVVPADTTLQSIVGTVVPGASSGGAGHDQLSAIRHRRARVRPDRLHRQSGRRRAPDVAAAPDQRRHPRRIHQLAGARALLRRAAPARRRAARRTLPSSA